MSVEAKGTTNESEIVQFLTFRVDDREYALNLTSVIQIIRLVSPGRAPAPDVVEGMFNLRGRNIPIVDPWQKWGSPRKAETTTLPLVIARANDHFIALAVDAVSDVLTLPKRNLEPVASEKMPIQAIGRTENRALFILDLEGL